MSNNDLYFRTAVLLHEGEEQVPGGGRAYIGVRCWDRNNPRYREARAIDDDRCDACGRREMPPRLTALRGGRS